jgi:8-oxo-dGTP diphosphatase
VASTIPEFGAFDPDVEYVPRPGGYAVIFRPTGEVAVVSTPAVLALPGGGQEPGESPEAAAVREARDECGLRIELGPLIGVADELVFADEEGKHYRKRCAFFFGRVVGRADAKETDHELLWLSPRDAMTRLAWGSQRWAVSEACRRAGR